MNSKQMEGNLRTCVGCVYCGEYYVNRMTLEQLDSNMGNPIEPSSLQKFPEIKVGDYTITVDIIDNRNLWIVKSNGEGMSFSPKLLDIFFNENM